MQIKLSSIYLQNWKCYREQTINFDLDTDKNIWVVFGNNGYGKTSLLEAILWCLYGVRAIYPDKREQAKFVDFFNSIAVEENPNLEMSVILTFKQETKIYRIIRAVKRIIRGNTVSFKQTTFSFSVGGKDRPDVRENIDFLLPELCKEFFFFDGKKIEEYAKLTHNQETRDAIERVLGVPEIRNLITDTKSTIKEIEKEFNKIAGVKQELKDINAELKEIQDKITIQGVKKKKLAEELNAENKLLNELDTEARQSEEVQSKFDEIKEKEISKSNLEKELSQILERIEKGFRKAPIYLLSDLVRETTDEIHTKTLIKNKQLADVSLLEKLLDNELCVCGRCINLEVRQYFEEQLEEAKNSEHLYEEALNNQKLHTELSIVCRHQTPDLDLLSLKRDEIEADISETEQAIDKLKKDTDGFDRESIKRIWQKLYQQQSTVKNKKKDIQRLEQDIEQLKTQESDLHKQRKKLASQNKEAANLSRQLDLAEKLYQAANELVEWRIDHSREIIEKYTSEIHQNITNKPKEYIGVKIEDDYTLGIRLKSGDIVNPERINFSAGEKEALAFAFIAGLNLASGKAAPLVMDTPFGHLDPEHRENIINSLPKIPSQVVLLATGADLPPNTLKDLEPDIVQIHTISREGESKFSSVIKVKQ